MPEHDGGSGRRRTRRLAGGVLALAGVMNLMSAITPPVASRLDLLRDLLPMGIEQTASALVAVTGIALLLLSRGVRRGQRHAWGLAVIMTALSAALHILKGLDIEEALVALVVLGYLLHHRRAFSALADRPSLTRALATLAFGGVTALVVGTMTALWIPDPSHMSVGRAFVAVAERLVGMHDVVIIGRRDRFLSPTLGAVGLALAVFTGWLVFRPVVRRRLTSTDEWTKARDIVARHGGDTLSYFALRDDKQHWFWHGTVVAYAVHNGVCLVSPDPVGPPRERHGAWQAFRQFADAHGWPVAIMGAGEEWRPVYHHTGMRDLYIGDEAIVDVRTFCLDGGRKKGLRQAVNRIEKYGYRIEFRDPSRLEPEFEAKLRALMTESRRGEVERGFSMTLGRVFSPDDRGLLMAVCFGPDGEPAAFCQYVPAADIHGYSLDLMRRSERGDHWNGVTDYVVVRTIEYLRDAGCQGLGLNFAVMRSVLAEEGGNGVGHRIERRMLGWLSDSMQIESLWKYNAKFDPDWRPRYAVYDTAENFLSSAVAVAKAESFWELPVVGRFFEPVS
ncbi:MAG: lysyl-tRNA synthetase, class [Acidimicrobiaceae bacterium]